MIGVPRTIHGIMHDCKQPKRDALLSGVTGFAFMSTMKTHFKENPNVAKLPGVDRSEVVEYLRPSFEETLCKCCKWIATCDIYLMLKK